MTFLVSQGYCATCILTGTRLPLLAKTNLHNSCRNINRVRILLSDGDVSAFRAIAMLYTSRYCPDTSFVPQVNELKCIYIYIYVYIYICIYIYIYIFFFFFFF